jgi:FkbM family methyltransferase
VLFGIAAIIQTAPERTKHIMQWLDKLRQLPKTLNYLLAHPLNRRRPAAALVRFLRWQIGSRLVPGPVAVPLIDSVRILAAPGMPGATGAAYLGLHEFADMALVLHFLRAGDLFVDVGANVGSYTLLAASTGAHCIALEPLPDTYRKLTMNLRLNEFLDRVEPLNVGVGAAPGALQFTSDLDTDNHVATAGYVGKVATVPVTTLDATLGARDAAMVKVDVEGYEFEVMRGCERILSERPPTVFIVEVNDASHRYHTDEASFVSKMRQFGYSPFDYDPVSRKLIALSRVSQRSNNTIFVKSPEPVEAITRTAPVRMILGRNV